MIDIERIHENMNRLLDELIRFRELPSSLPLLSGETTIDKPKRRIDIAESDKEIIATAEIPGFKKDDISINITDNRLEILAETKREEEKKEEGYLYRERYRGNYYRAMSLHSPVDSSNTKASYTNGILEIKMPKIEIKKKIPIKVE